MPTYRIKSKFIFYLLVVYAICFFAFYSNIYADKGGYVGLSSGISFNSDTALLGKDCSYPASKIRPSFLIGLNTGLILTYNRELLLSFPFNIAYIKRQITENKENICTLNQILLSIGFKTHMNLHYYKNKIDFGFLPFGINVGYNFNKFKKGDFLFELEQENNLNLDITVNNNLTFEFYFCGIEVFFTDNICLTIEPYFIISRPETSGWLIDINKIYGDLIGIKFSFDIWFLKSYEISI